MNHILSLFLFTFHMWIHSKGLLKNFGRNLQAQTNCVTSSCLILAQN